MVGLLPAAAACRRSSAAPTRFDSEARSARPARASSTSAAIDESAAAGALSVATGSMGSPGVATSTDVLDAQVALLQAGLDRTQAIANARLAEARLARAIGKQK